MRLLRPHNLALLLIALLAQAAFGQSFDLPGDGEAKAKVELLVADTTVQPGQTVAVGVKFTMQPGWHIYWHNPGDSGEPPTFAWNLPGGGAARMMRGGEWTATEPQFPTPITFESSGLVGFGYKDTVIFPATVTVPATATPGQAVELAIATNYLICEEVCIPEQAVATASIEVSTQGEHDDDATDAIALAERQLPVPGSATPHVKAVNQAGDDDARTITVDFARAVENVEFFPDPPRGLAVEDVSVDVAGNTATVRFTTRTLSGATVNASEFPAVVGYTADGVRVGVRMNVPTQNEAHDEAGEAESANKSSNK